MPSHSPPVPSPAQPSDPGLEDDRIDLIAQKAALRERLRNARTDHAGQLGRIGQRAAARAAAAHFIDGLSPPPGLVVAGYAAFTDEMDPAPLGKLVRAKGGVWGLPVIENPDEPLLFRRWTTGERLQPGPFGTRHPLESAEVISPDVVLVPLTGFDGLGQRIGQGGGFYDRTLEKLRHEKDHVLAIGIGYAMQQVAQVPTGPMDQPLDGVVTEAGLRLFSGDSLSAIRTTWGVD